MSVNPLPGANSEHLLKTLREIHTAAINARSASSDAYTIYLRWVDDSARILRGQLGSGELERLVLTRRYWLLQSMAPTFAGLGGGAGLASVGALVATELDERVTVFEEAYQALDRQIQRWARPGVFAVADTSVYIHHPQKLEELDLAASLNIREEPVHLLVPMVVVDELDGLKQANKPQPRWRARHTLFVLDRLLASPGEQARLRVEDFSALASGGIPRGEITVELVFDPPGHVRLPINDDEIIDRAVTIQALAARPVTLITYDTGQSTRARIAGLTVVKLAQPPEGQEPMR